MFANSMFDTDRRSWSQAPRISHWVFDASPGQISGCDGQGRVLLAIAADALFGQRLAAAFNSPAATRVPADPACLGARLRPPAFPF